jgi:hypothetical protein
VRDRWTQVLRGPGSSRAHQERFAKQALGEELGAHSPSSLHPDEDAYLEHPTTLAAEAEANTIPTARFCQSVAHN